MDALSRARAMGQQSYRPHATVGTSSSTARFFGLAACVSAFACSAPTTAQDALRAELQVRLDSLTEGTGIPGATLGVALDDGSSFGLASGWADTTVRRPMEPSDRMLQGSVGKTYFGAVALQLVHEGRIDLDATVSTYLGEEDWFGRIPNAADITVRQLMNHTSGVVRYEFNPTFIADLNADPFRTWTPVQRLEYLFGSEAPFPAGDGWEYSDTNYILVAMIIESVTGNAAYAEISRRLLEPLGIVNTVPSDSRDIEGLVQGYAGDPNPFGGSPEMLVEGRLTINPQFEWGGGGFASTTEDLARWARDIHEGRAFDESLLEEVRTGPEVPLGPGGRYGLGVIMLELPVGSAWGHSGFMPGYRTEMYYFPEGRFGLALQVNSSDPGAFDRPLGQILNALAEVVMASTEAP